MIPYARQTLDDEDLQAVLAVLKSDYLTTGPEVAAFEQDVAGVCRAGHAVAVSSGTAALHAAMHALGLGPGDEVIVPTMSFAATANCVLYQGARVVFADVDPDTLLLTPEIAAKKITPRTRALIAVDYAGQPCDWDGLRALADKHGLRLVADACHALGGSLGGSLGGRPVGGLADLTCLSFHPAKHVTTGEGGMILTEDAALAERMRHFRTHGISTDHRQRAEHGTWFYEMTELGFNYRISDIQCALGRSQLKKLPAFLRRRREIAARYDAAFAGHAAIRPLTLLPGREHAYHLYVVRVPQRDAVFAVLREQGVACNVHYIPIHLHPYYQQQHGTQAGMCPLAEAAYAEILSLPMFPGLTDAEQDTVVKMLITTVDALK